MVLKKVLENYIKILEKSEKSVWTLYIINLILYGYFHDFIWLLVEIQTLWAIRAGYLISRTAFLKHANYKMHWGNLNRT